MNDAGFIVVVCIGLAVGVAYFMPTLIAIGRHHHQATAIFLLNVFLGWTFLGWVAALVMAFTYIPAEVRNRQADHQLMARRYSRR